MEEDDNCVGIRIEYVVLGGSESYHNYPMLWSNGEQGFLVFAGAPSRSGFAVNVYVRSEHRYRREVEGVIRILEGDFNISILNTYYPQERFSGGSGGNVSDQYPAKVEEYERTDTAALDDLFRRAVSNQTTETN